MATHKQRVFKFDLRAKKITEVGKGAIGVIMLTTRPYPLEDAAEVSSYFRGIYNADLHRLLVPQDQDVEQVKGGSATISAARLKLGGLAYNSWPTEEAKGGSVSVSAARLKLGGLAYKSWPTEEAKGGSVAVVAGRLTVVLQKYPLWPTEEAKGGPITVNAARLIPKP